MSDENRPRVVVGALILNKKKEVLLIKSFKWKGHFYIPGGHVEEGERMTQALKREIYEEVGLKVKISQFLGFQEGIFSPLYHKRRHFIFFDYLCQTIGSEKVTPDEIEAEEFLWVKPLEALAMKIDPFTRRAIKIYLKNK